MDNKCPTQYHHCYHYVDKRGCESVADKNQERQCCICGAYEADVALDELREKEAADRKRQR